MTNKIIINVGIILNIKVELFKWRASVLLQGNIDSLKLFVKYCTNQILSLCG